MEGSLLCIGPVVAPDERTAADLIVKSALDHPGPVRLDVPEGKNDLFQMLEEDGFELERIPPLLSFGGQPLPAMSSNYMALAGQALG